MRVPRRAALAAVLGDVRRDELEDDQGGRERERRRERQVDEDEHDPAELDDRDEDGVRQGGASASGVVLRGAQPQRDRGDAHDDVAGHDHAVVDVLALVERVEQRREAERQHEHAEHLDHRGDAEEDVVVVVGRREPRVVDPRPPDREHREQEPGDRRCPVPELEQVRRLRARLAERHDEREVEEQLQWRRGAVRLVRVAPDHAPQAVVEGRASGCLGVRVLRLAHRAALPGHAAAPVASCCHMGRGDRIAGSRRRPPGDGAGSARRASSRRSARVLSARGAAPRPGRRRRRARPRRDRRRGARARAPRAARGVRRMPRSGGRPRWRRRAR